MRLSIAHAFIVATTLALATTSASAADSAHAELAESRMLQAQATSNATKPAECMPLSQEPWAVDVEFVCAFRKAGGYDFYYKLSSGKFMRNCFCKKSGPGLENRPPVQHNAPAGGSGSSAKDACYSKDKKNSFEKIDALFAAIKCVHPSKIQRQ